MNTLPSTCTVSGSLSALPGMDAQAICDRFQSDLAAAMGSTPVPQGLAFALIVHKRGAIDARISAGPDGAGADYPSVSFDVVDRNLVPEDLAQLARTVAGVLASQPSTHSASMPAQHKGN